MACRRKREASNITHSSFYDIGALVMDAGYLVEDTQGCIQWLHVLANHVQPERIYKGIHGSAVHAMGVE